MSTSLLEHILDLVNLLSDIPILSLSDKLAFEPLQILLHSEQLAMDPHLDEELRGLIIMKLINFASQAIEPLISYALYDLNINQPYNDTINARTLRGDHPRNMSRKIAIQQIGKLSDTRAISGLMQILQRDRNPIILKNVIYAVEQINDDCAIQAMVEMLLSHPDAVNRKIIAEGFKNFVHPEIVSALILALKDAEAVVSISALKSLSQIKPPIAFPFLIEASNDFRKSSEGYATSLNIVALAAVEAILSYPTDQATEIAFEWCVSNFTNEDTEIRIWAVGKLGAIGRNRALPFIEDLLNSMSTTHQNDLSLLLVVQVAINAIDTPEALATLEKWQSAKNNP